MDRFAKGGTLRNAKWITNQTIVALGNYKMPALRWRTERGKHYVKAPDGRLTLVLRSYELCGSGALPESGPVGREARSARSAPMFAGFTKW